MKRAAFLFLFLLILLLLAGGVQAAGLSGLVTSAGALPDPAELLGVEGVLYESNVLKDNAFYFSFTFPMPKDYEQFLARYTAAAQDAGYRISDGSAYDRDATRISVGVKDAYLVPDFSGALLFLVHSDMAYGPIPTPMPEPTAKPTAVSVPSLPASNGGGHVEHIEVKQDCFACVGGVCDLCNGSGWYRNYGERVYCSPYCKTCDGLGYWIVSQPVWVP